MLEFLVVGIGGFIGCCLRFGITKLLLPLNMEFPFATLISNVIAGIVVGFVVELEKNTLWMTPKIRLFLNTGMMGGLSTFSTFSFETVHLFNQRKIWLATGNVLLNVSLSLFGVVMGMLVAKLLIKGRM